MATLSWPTLTRLSPRVLVVRYITPPRWPYSTYLFSICQLELEDGGDGRQNARMFPPAVPRKTEDRWRDTVTQVRRLVRCLQVETSLYNFLNKLISRFSTTLCKILNKLIASFSTNSVQVSQQTFVSINSSQVSQGKDFI